MRRARYFQRCDRGFERWQFWCNCPALGILSASRVSFLLNLVTNVLSDFGLNGVCFLIHPNRASNNADGRLELRDSIYSIIHPIHHPDSPNTLSP